MSLFLIFGQKIEILRWWLWFCVNPKWQERIYSYNMYTLLTWCKHLDLPKVISELERFTHPSPFFRHISIVKNELYAYVHLKDIRKNLTLALILYVCFSVFKHQSYQTSSLYKILLKFIWDYIIRDSVYLINVNTIIVFFI